MKNFIKSFVTDESGASAAEYALILAIVGAGIGGAAWVLGDNIRLAIGGAATHVSSCTGGTAGSGTTAQAAPTGC